MFLQNNETVSHFLQGDLFQNGRWMMRGRQIVGLKMAALVRGWSPDGGILGLSWAKFYGDGPL